MKINLTDTETYTINIPEEINSEDFIKLFEKMQQISKFLNIGNNSFQLKTKKKYIKYSFSFDTREKVLDLFQYYYHGNLEDRKRIIKITGRDLILIQKNLSQIRKKYNVQPNEIGLKCWKKARDNKIDDWVIKSYTGVFDENGNKEDEDGKNEEPNADN